MRLTAFALALLMPTAAEAARINHEYSMGCRELELRRRITRVLASGDKDGGVALIQKALDSGACVPLPKGTRVRIEELTYPFACVAAFGSTDACTWVEQREIDTKD